MKSITLVLLLLLVAVNARSQSSPAERAVSYAMRDGKVTMDELRLLSSFGPAIVTAMKEYPDTHAFDEFVGRFMALGHPEPFVDMPDESRVERGRRYLDYRATVVQRHNNDKRDAVAYFTRLQADRILASALQDPDFDKERFGGYDESYGRFFESVVACSQCATLFTERAYGDLLEAWEQLVYGYSMTEDVNRSNLFAAFPIFNRILREHGVTEIIEVDRESFYRFCDSRFGAHATQYEDQEAVVTYYRDWWTRNGPMIIAEEEQRALDELKRLNGVE